MLNIIFNVVGIFFIIYSVVILKMNFDNKKSFEEKKYDEDSKKNFEDVLNDKSLSAKIDKAKKIDKKSEMDLLFGKNIEKDINSGIYSRENIVKKNNNKNNNIYKKSNKTSLIIDNTTRGFNDENDLKSQVYTLKKMGLTNQEIAKKLNKGIREIEIIVKLNKID